MLHHAAEHQRLAGVEFLVKNGVPTDSLNKVGLREFRRKTVKMATIMWDMKGSRYFFYSNII